MGDHWYNLGHDSIFKWLLSRKSKASGPQLKKSVLESPFAKELLAFRDESLLALSLAHDTLFWGTITLGQVAAQSETVIETGQKLRSVYEIILKCRDISKSLKTKENVLDFVENAIPPGSVVCGNITSRSTHRLAMELVFRIGENMSIATRAEEWAQRLSELEELEFDDPEAALRDLKETAKTVQEIFEMGKLSSLPDDYTQMTTTIRNEYSVALQALNANRASVPTVKAA